MSIFRGAFNEKILRMNDYLFVKYYRWFEYLNRVYRKHRINWQEDCLELAISNLSFLQGLQTAAIGIILFYKFVYNKVVDRFLSEGTIDVFFFIIVLFPFIIYKKKNRKRYVNKDYYKKVLSDIRWQKKSVIWSIFYIIITLALVLISMLYIVKS